MDYLLVLIVFSLLFFRFGFCLLGFKETGMTKSKHLFSRGTRSHSTNPLKRRCCPIGPKHRTDRPRFFCAGAKQVSYVHSRRGRLMASCPLSLLVLAVGLLRAANFYSVLN